MFKIEDEKKKEVTILIQAGLTTKSIVLILKSEINELKNQGFPLADIAIMIAQALQLDIKIASFVKDMKLRQKKDITMILLEEIDEEASEWFIEDKRDGMHVFRFETGENYEQF
jgi:hypothetical protein